MSQEGLPQKYVKKIPAEFIDTIEAMSTDEIKQRIVQIEHHIFEIEKAKATDQELNGAREKARDLAKPYRENKSEETAKIKYCLHMLENRGVNL